MKAEKTAELLLEHHKDTYQHILYHWRLRNRLFVLVLILLALMSLDTYSPEFLPGLANAYIHRTLGNQVQVDFSVIGSLAWFLLVSLVIQYYQRSIHVTRHYFYLAEIERMLCEQMGGPFITREGLSYYSQRGTPEVTEETVDRRPLFMRMVAPLYTYFFPFMLILLVVVKLIRESLNFDKATDWFNLIMGVVIILYTLLYVHWVIWGQKAEQK
ncbi:MAG: hypothetical protein D6681_08415 [Calditrichaeota bacterium]|nr:MAG: hypothetical protein D6681_08415 [Calditrichota bacterium]